MTTEAANYPTHKPLWRERQGKQEGLCVVCGAQGEELNTKSCREMQQLLALKRHCLVRV